MAKFIHKRRMGCYKRALNKATKGSEPFADVDDKPWKKSVVAHGSTTIWRWETKDSKWWQFCNCIRMINYYLKVRDTWINRRTQEYLLEIKLNYFNVQITLTGWQTLKKMCGGTWINYYLWRWETKESRQALKKCVVAHGSTTIYEGERQRSLDKPWKKCVVAHGSTTIFESERQRSLDDDSFATALE